MSYYVGIDLGGTNIAAGVVDEKFRIIARSKLKTNRELSGDEVIRCCAEAARLAVENAGLKMENISAVGLGSPGTVNCETGVIEYANNLNLQIRRPPRYFAASSGYLRMQRTTQTPPHMRSL